MLKAGSWHYIDVTHMQQHRARCHTFPLVPLDLRLLVGLLLTCTRCISCADSKLKMLEDEAEHTEQAF